MNRMLMLSVMVLSFSVAGVARAEEAGGVTWTAPAEWAVQPERPMRSATYSIPAVKGDLEPAELAVFYFGEGKGGGVDANVKRWVNQFKKANGASLEKEVKPKQEQIAGFPVTLVDVKGTYMGGGPMMGPTTPKPGFRLIGAIVESPAGALFFKLTGPEKTVTATEKSFRKMLEGMKKK